MGSAGNKRYSPSSYTHSVLQLSCFSPAAGLYKWEGTTSEQRPRAEQGQKCTQRHYRAIASASSTVIFQKSKEKDLLILGKGTVPFAPESLPQQGHPLASHVHHAQPSFHALSDQLWHSPYHTSHSCQCWQGRGLARASWLDRCMHWYFLLLLCMDWGIGSATKGVGLNPTKQCLSTFTFWQWPHSLCKTVLSTSQ